MAFDLLNAAEILKVRYLGPIREQLNNQTIFFKRVAKDGAGVSVLAR